MREFFAMLLSVICFSGCAYQLRGTNATPSEAPKDSQLAERVNEPLSIGPVESLPRPLKGPVPELQIGMSQDEVEETLAKSGMPVGGLPSMTIRGGWRSIVYRVGGRDVSVWYDIQSRRLKSYKVTDSDG